MIREKVQHHCTHELNGNSNFFNGMSECNRAGRHRYINISIMSNLKRYNTGYLKNLN